MADLIPLATIATAVVGTGFAYLSVKFPGSRRRRRRDQITTDLALRDAMASVPGPDLTSMNRHIQFQIRALLASEEPWTETEIMQGRVGWFSLIVSTLFLGLGLGRAEPANLALNAVAFLLVFPYLFLHLKRATTLLERQNNLLRDGEVSPPPAP